MSKLWKRSEVVPLVLLILAFAWAAVTNRQYLDLHYLINSTSLYAELVLIALGVMLVIVTGNIDLSMASNLALTACVTAKVMAAGIPVPVACLLGLGLSCALGAFNGVLVAYGKLPSFLVTLGTLALYRGLAQALTGSASVQLPKEFVGIDHMNLGPTGVPIPLVVIIVAAVAIGLFLHRTIPGRWSFAVGTNEMASRFAAVPVERVKMTAYILCGLLAGVGALLIDSRLGWARHDHARGLELDAITAVVLGGVSIRGGSGTVVGTMLALALVAMVRTGLGLANISAEYQLTVIGALLILAVGATSAVTRLNERRRPAKVAKVEVMDA